VQILTGRIFTTDDGPRRSGAPPARWAPGAKLNKSTFSEAVEADADIL
jgi:hypothetical protein